jgi:protein ImuB
MSDALSKGQSPGSNPQSRPNGERVTPMRILSLFLPKLSTDRLIRRRRRGEEASSDAPPEGVPLAVVAKIKNAMRVVAADRIAETRGIRLGVSLADARGAVPDLHVVEADEAADLALLEKVADWCDRYTPLITFDPPHSLFLDISGCAHLFSPLERGARGRDAGGDSEAALLADCLQRLAGQGFTARGAIASTAGAAWALAHYGKGGVVPAGGEAEAIADLPVAALRIAAEDESLLDSFGLKSIAQLYDKPRAPLAARFSRGLMTRLDQALGHLDEVLKPRRPAPQLSAERRFAEPLLERDSLLESVRSLAQALQPALVRHGLGARHLEAAFFRIDGEVARLSVGTAGPLRAADTMAKLFAERLSALESKWEAEFGFDMVRLTVHAAEPLDATQIDLAGRAESDADLTRLADRLGARLGPGQVTRFLAVDTHIPEHAVRMTPLAKTADAPLAWALPQDGSETPPNRPLRLFPRPEPISVMAEVPEGPPLRFRWRRAMYEVARAEGPERIAPEWWRPENEARATRDYYRVEDAEGRRYWLFREGLYGRETGQPSWYMHGLFG